MARSRFPDPMRPLRRAIVGGVRATFNDAGRGETPVERSPDALHDDQSVIWRVHGDVGTMMIGGVAALLLQMLHPAALAGVWDHSSFRTDMTGRLRRTARFIAITTYGARDDAEASIARVRAIHGRVRGTLPGGGDYRADDPRLLAWVHACETICFLDAWVRYGEPAMRAADRDAYFAEAAGVARALGADPVPETETGMRALLATYRPELRADARTREVARLLLDRPSGARTPATAQRILTRAALALLPSWARAMHGRATPVLSRPFVDGGAFAMATTLRWAFADDR